MLQSPEQELSQLTRDNIWTPSPLLSFSALSLQRQAFRHLLHFLPFILISGQATQIPDEM